MINAKIFRRSSAWLVFVVGAWFTVALAASSHARSNPMPAKKVNSQAKGSLSSAKAAPAKTAKAAARTHPVAGVGRDLLMRLEVGSKELQKQLQTLAATNQRRTDDLNQGIASVAGQLQRLNLAQQQSAATQQLLIASIRSAHRLLVIIVTLMAVLCAAVLFYGFQFIQFGRGPLMKDRRPIDAPDQPERSLEAQWKVGS
jgi:hypothetical protein